MPVRPTAPLFDVSGRNRLAPSGWITNEVLPLALLLAAALILYSGRLDMPFFFDDVSAIVENETIRELGDLPRVLQPPADTPVAGRPITNLTLAVDYAVGGLEPRTYRRGNLLLHILNSMLLYGLVRLTLRSSRVSVGLSHWAGGLAFWSALLWLVHPLQSEVVLYATQRSEALVSFFYLTTMCAAVLAWSGRRGVGWSLLAVAACALGMASKEVMVTAPVMVVAWDVLFRDTPPGSLWRRRGVLYAGLAATWLVLGFLVAAAPRGASAGFSVSLGPWTYLANQCRMIPEYLRLVFWPRPLVADYGYPEAVRWVEALPGLLLLTCLAAVTLYGLVRRRPAAFLGLWFFGLLAPSSSLVPIATEVGAERRVYLAAAAVVVLAVLVGWRLLWESLAGDGRTGGRAVVAAGIAGIFAAGLLSQVTVQRARDYRSPVALWSSVVEARPANYRGHNNLGRALAAEGRDREAESHFSAALRLRGDYPDAHSNLCNALRVRGALDEAIESCRRALELAPDLAEAHNNLGAALGESGELRLAIRHFERALEIEPGYTAASRNLRLARDLERSGD